MNKKEIRIAMKNKRKALLESEILAFSDLIGSNVLRLKEVKDADTVMVYSDFAGEVKTDKLISELLIMGKRVCLPVVVGDDMFAADVNAEKYTLNIYGISEPEKENAVKVSEEDIDVCIIPGLAFDNNFMRLGFGKGYYDRFLSRTKKCFKIGLAYDFQIIASLPSEEHDIPLDMIVTQNSILRR